MAGFDPVGSTPVGAVGTSVATGTFFNPGAGVATFSGAAPTVTGLISPIFVSQETVETLFIASADAYVSQITVEVLMSTNTQDLYQNYQFVNT